MYIRFADFSVLQTLARSEKISLAYFTALMNDILSEILSEMREYIECIMDDCIIFTPDIDI